MSCPGSYPTVLNGQMSSSDNNTAEYECLSGFSMSGLKRITCSSGVWQSAPTCSVIRQYDEYTTFPDWWLFALAIILGLMLLACFLCLCLYFCCCRGRPHGSGCCDGGPCSCCRRGRRTGAWEEDVDGRYHVIRVSPQPHDHGNSDGVYFVPVSEGAHLVASQRHPTKNRATNTDKEDRKQKDQGKKKSSKTIATNTDDDFDYESSDYKTSRYVYGTPRTLDAYAWKDQRGPGASKAWKDSSNLETRSDGDLTERPPKAKKPAKEVRAWLPHANPVRNINTSTK